MERPRSMPRYSASRFAGMAAAAHDGSTDDSASLALALAAAARGEEAPLSTTSSAKRTRFLPSRHAFSRFFRFSATRREETSQSGSSVEDRARKAAAQDRLTGRGEAGTQAGRRSAACASGGGGGRDLQVRRLLGAADGEEDERARERHGGGGDGEARVRAGARRGRGRVRRHHPRRRDPIRGDLALACRAASADEREDNEVVGERWGGWLRGDPVLVPVAL